MIVDGIFQVFEMLLVVAEKDLRIFAGLFHPRLTKHAACDKMSVGRRGLRRSTYAGLG